MTDYWKSVGNYWCQYCRMFVRNTPSEKTKHEQHPKHQANVSKFLAQRKKQKTAEELQQKHLEHQLKRINRAAEKAYRYDIPVPAKKFNESPTVQSTGTKIKSSSHQFVNRPKSGWEANAPSMPVNFWQYKKQRQQMKMTMKQQMKSIEKFQEEIVKKLGLQHHLGDDYVEEEEDQTSQTIPNIADISQVLKKAEEMKKEEKIDEKNVEEKKIESTKDIKKKIQEYEEAYYNDPEFFYTEAADELVEMEEKKKELEEKEKIKSKEKLEEIKREEKTKKRKIDWDNYKLEEEYKKNIDPTTGLGKWSVVEPSPTVQLNNETTNFENDAIQIKTETGENQDVLEQQTDQTEINNTENDEFQHDDDVGIREQPVVGQYQHGETSAAKKRKLSELDALLQDAINKAQS